MNKWGDLSLTVKEISEAQKLDKYEKTLMENTSVFYHKGKLVISRSLQHHAVGTTTSIYSTLETHASKSQLKLQCTVSICVPLYDHMSKTVDPAR